MIEILAMVMAIILPFWNIPLILRIIRLRSSRDISMFWALGVWLCFVLMFPAALSSPDPVWKIFSLVNLVFFSLVVFVVLLFRKKEVAKDMEFEKVVSKRSSVRKYRPESLPRELLQKLAAAGAKAPSARGVEPWEFVIVTERDVLEKLAGICPNGAFLANAAAAIVVFCRDTKYYLEDGCAATENILLQAAAEGLGACWIAGDKKDYASTVTAMFKAPAEVRLVSLISLGWPEEDKLQQKNRQPDSLVHWEKF